MTWLERMFLGRAAVEKLDAAQRRLEESDKRDEQLEKDEAAARQEIRELVVKIRADTEKHVAVPPKRLRHVSIPDIEDL